MSASCATTSSRGCHPHQAARPESQWQEHPGPAAAGEAQAWMAVEEMWQQEGSSSGEDWSTGDENDAE
eukprot:1144419-Pelagomonas_calceolata.AAC.6